MFTRWEGNYYWQGQLLPFNWWCLEGRKGNFSAAWKSSAWIKSINLMFSVINELSLLSIFFAKDILWEWFKMFSYSKRKIKKYLNASQWIWHSLQLVHANDLKFLYFVFLIVKSTNFFGILSRCSKRLMQQKLYYYTADIRAELKDWYREVTDKG